MITPLNFAGTLATYRSTIQETMLVGFDGEKTPGTVYIFLFAWNEDHSLDCLVGQPVVLVSSFNFLMSRH